VWWNQSGNSKQPRSALAAKFSASKGAAAAAELTVTHSRVLGQLQVVSQFTRAIGMLSALELNTLEHACTSFGEAFRLSYPSKTLTVKGHIAEKYVAAFARKCGTCGAFGEDDLESWHPWDTRCRLITRAMRNPKARHRANMSNLGIKVRAHVPAPSPATWTSAKAAATAAAVAIAAAQQPALGAGPCFPVNVLSP
jgi:hypothetical protein